MIHRSKDMIDARVYRLQFNAASWGALPANWSSARRGVEGQYAGSCKWLLYETTDALAQPCMYDFEIKLGRRVIQTTPWSLFCCLRNSFSSLAERNTMYGNDVLSRCEVVASRGWTIRRDDKISLIKTLAQDLKPGRAVEYERNLPFRSMSMLTFIKSPC